MRVANGDGDVTKSFGPSRILADRPVVIAALSAPAAESTASMSWSRWPGLFPIAPTLLRRSAHSQDGFEAQLFTKCFSSLPGGASKLTASRHRDRTRRRGVR